MRIPFAVLVVIAAAAVAAPWLIQANARATWRAKEETLRHQSDRLAKLGSENEHLSNRLAEAGQLQQTLAGDELRELLRLRNEVRGLREQSGRVGKLREENQRLIRNGTNPPGARTEKSPAELDAELAGEFMDAMRNVAAELPAALQRFAADHTNQPPNDFFELRPYFPKIDGRPMTGLYSFEFVRDEGPQPGDALLLREFGSRPTADGKRARGYVFSDGRTVEIRLDDGTFESWEQAQLRTRPAGK